MRILVQVSLLLFASAIGGAVGALLARPASVPTATAPVGSTRGTAGTVDLAGIEARIARLEEETFRPRLMGAGVGVRLNEFEDRISALEEHPAPVASPETVAHPRTATQVQTDAADRDAKPLDDALAMVRRMQVTKGNAEARLALWSKVIEGNPSDGVLLEAWEGAAWAHSALRQHPEAAKAYQEVVRIAGPDSETALQASLRLAQSQSDAGDKASARATLEGLTMSRNVRQPLLSHAWLHLARLAEDAGDSATARRAYQWIVDENAGAALPVLRFLAEEAQQHLDSTR